LQEFNNDDAGWIVLANRREPTSSWLARACFFLALACAAGSFQNIAGPFQGRG
jgi:hypothetical protein